MTNSNRFAKLDIGRRQAPPDDSQRRFAPEEVGRWLVALALVVVAACGPGGSGGDTDGAVVDGGPADALVPPDAFNANLGQPCDSADDCPGGYCVDGPQGADVCTYPCTDGCPDGWSCRVTDVGGDLVSVCLPVVVEVCAPCTDDDQCAGGVCIILDGEGWCLASCFESACPGGFDCEEDPTGTHPGSFCIPETGSCSCSAENEGAMRTCSVTNAVGTCYGFEVCDATLGWTGCDAPTASPEVCNGLDDDCDFLIDDGVAGGDPCVNTNGFGSCPGATFCTGAGGTICQGPTPEAETCNFTDDDCDLSIDEGFPGLNTVCSDGVGACLRFGVVHCTADELGTECSAVAGTPSGELCNAIDDDCDGPVDEAFPTLGDPCSAGVGICERLGNFVCNGPGTGVSCSAVAGAADPSETCNGLDDDCDGPVDEGYLNPGTGQYDQDFACGSCAIDCTDLYDLPNASGSCDASGAPTCVMDCDVNAFDLNSAVGDGCEFILDTGAIYVSTSDPAASDVGACGLGPVGTGAGHYPCKTIGNGIARANTLNRPRVLVANGIYDEAVTIANGRNLLGGYAWDTWERDVAATDTQIAGVSSSGNHDRTVIAVNISSATLFEGFVVLGAVNTKPGGNSYAIYVSNSGGLAIRNNSVFGGRGGPGATGSAGGAGLLGVNGGGRPTPDPLRTYNVKQAVLGNPQCDAQNNRLIANGGARSCGGTIVSGGRGGGNTCPTSNRDANNNNNFDFGETTIQQTAGNGVSGSGTGAGVGGTGGEDMQLETLTCWVEPGNHVGDDGNNGANGGHGAAVTGCSTTAGAVSGGHWVGTSGSAGLGGANGGGGGGGGAGGGSYCDNCPDNDGVAPVQERDWLGGHGGGGGSGGCGGAGGGIAGPGGGTFAIFVVTGTAPAITGNTLFRGEGGRGGNGGAGGTGGDGGTGGEGGTVVAYGANDGSHCSENGGRGGNGGDGGHGSGGGGGCGGNSYGIYTSGVGSPTYCMAGDANTILSGGAGTGGAGGFSIINPGGAGTAGVLATCSFN